MLLKNDNLKFKIFFTLGCVLFSFACNTALAYTETTDGGDLLAEVYPKNPGSFVDVSIELVSYEIDLERSNIIWSINGKKQKEGIGQDNIKFTTGEIGKKIIIDIKAASQDGKNITKQISIIPAETEILWQAENHLPPFYRGKSLATPGSNIKFVALPSFISEKGISISPTNLVYKWSINSEDTDSGYGRNVLETRLSEPYIENNIFVDISTLDNSLRATKLIKLSPQKPIVLFYENNPLSGTVYEKSIIDNLVMNEAEKIVRVEPYFSNLKDIAYSWAINAEDLSTSKDNKPELTIRQGAGSSGESILNVLVSSPYQSTQKSIRIKFGQTNF